MTYYHISNSKIIEFEFGTLLKNEKNFSIFVLIYKDVTTLKRLSGLDFVYGMEVFIILTTLISGIFKTRAVTHHRR